MTDRTNDGMKLSMIGAIPVTPEMIAAGEEAIEMIQMLGASAPDVEVIYRAMAALAPVELVSAGELAALKERDVALQRASADRAAAMYARNDLHQIVRERDAALAMRNETMAALEVMRAERDEALIKVAQRFTLAEVNAILDARDAMLARRPAAFVDPEPEALKHNPFREFGGDRRRVGR